MNAFLQNPWVFGAASGLGGAIVALAVRAVLGKRGLFTYNVMHNRVAVSAEDEAFGSVSVTWAGRPVTNLYISTIELRNESYRDFENVVVKVWSTSTELLTQRIELVGTTTALLWTESFEKRLAIAAGAEASPEQVALVHGLREFLVPTLNRGQVVRLAFLNAATVPEGPSIWLDVVHPGVKLKFALVPQQFMGEPQPAAALVGTVLGIGVVVAIAFWVSSPAVAATLGLIYGVVVLVPGALAMKLWRAGRQLVAD